MNSDSVETAQTPTQPQPTPTEEKRELGPADVLNTESVNDPISLG